jgi:hypothetical protein
MSKMETVLYVKPEVSRFIYQCTDGGGFSGSSIHAKSSYGGWYTGEKL